MWFPVVHFIAAKLAKRNIVAQRRTESFDEWISRILIWNNAALNSSGEFATGFVLLPPNSLHPPLANGDDLEPKSGKLVIV